MMGVRLAKVASASRKSRGTVPLSLDGKDPQARQDTLQHVGARLVVRGGDSS